ncbi:MAG: hypothetical protein AAFO28_08285, partial [Pseudomonadota bacterium]
MTSHAPVDHTDAHRGARPDAAHTMKTVTVIQGQARASASPNVEMSTILGSCVATCLYDPFARIGGLNHFLLAQPPKGALDDGFDSTYGLYLMELLVNKMLELGAAKSRLKARL